MWLCECDKNFVQAFTEVQMFKEIELACMNYDFIFDVAVNPNSENLHLVGFSC